MSGSPANPAVVPRPSPGVIRGLAKLTRMLLAGEDMSAIFAEIHARLDADPDDAAALIDASICRNLAGAAADSQALRERALELRRVYHLPAGPGGSQGRRGEEKPGPRLLALAASGDFMANTPVEFLLDGSEMALDLLYIPPGRPLPDPPPEHDVAMVVVGESTANRALLEELTAVTAAWPRPLINPPARILRTSREELTRRLKNVPGVFVAPLAAVDRAALERIARGELDPGTLLEGAGFPIIVRPDDSHAGHGLERLDEPAMAAGYLERHEEDSFTIARFLDYRSKDGLYRKARIALVDGQAFLCHLSIGTHWMQHYVNADMVDNAKNRAEEAAAMAGFEREWGQRHAAALAGVATAIGLDYFCIDCAETPDGRLFVFEGDNAMIIHDMDPVDRFAYKKPQMHKVFAAFREMLRRRANQEDLMPNN